MTDEILDAPYPTDFTCDVDGKKFKYISNPKLKAADTRLAFEKEHIKELKRCSNDKEYFARRYYKIITQDDGLVNIDLRPYQLDCLNVFDENRFSILKYPRQTGKCQVYDIIIHLRNKKTGELRDMEIGKLYEELKD